MSSYTPTVWADGDTITAAKMNKLESGVANAIADAAEASAGAGGGGVLVVGATISEDAVTLNKTAGEIIEASKSGLVLLPSNYESDSVAISYLSWVNDYGNGSEYDIWFTHFADRKDDIVYQCYRATAINDYPTAEISDSGEAS